jgi:hypothetical protein
LRRLQTAKPPPAMKPATLLLALCAGLLIAG